MTLFNYDLTNHIVVGNAHPTNTDVKTRFKINQIMIFYSNRKGG